MPGSTDPDASHTRIVEAMAMPFVIEAVPSPGLGAADFDAVVDAMHADLLWADSVFSMWNEDSPVSRLARGEVALEDCPPAVAEVFAECDAYRAATAGAFDARRPDGATDPTGVVKTWAVARALWRLDHAGYHDWMVGASGDVVVSGTGPGGLPWRIGIADPARAGDPQGAAVVDVVELGGERRALCTSGTAQHGQHIWNTEGQMAARYAQVSVVGPDLVATDAWATAIVAGGERTALAAQEAGLEVLCIPAATPGDRIAALGSPGWPSAVS